MNFSFFALYYFFLYLKSAPIHVIVHVLHSNTYGIYYTAIRTRLATGCVMNSYRDVVTFTPDIVTGLQINGCPLASEGQKMQGASEFCVLHAR